MRSYIKAIDLFVPSEQNFYEFKGENELTSQTWQGKKIAHGQRINLYDYPGLLSAYKDNSTLIIDSTKEIDYWAGKIEGIN